MRNEPTKILIIGSNGQLGTELVKALRAKYGLENVLAADLQPEKEAVDGGRFIQLDILNKHLLEAVIKVNNITEIYALAAILSATGEQEPRKAWHLNMNGLLNVLELAALFRLKVFWPSSIAVFGPGAPRGLCPQKTLLEPATVYGISKMAGELWCQYYFDKYGLDIRSLRYPGLIGYTAPPGGGTTDYAVAIFHEALENGTYTCFLDKHTCLPMMYMPDAIRATLELMEAPAEKISVRTSYNIAAMHFSPGQLAAAIQQHLPGFRIHYQPDYRQAIADGWPPEIDDSVAARDWGWKAGHDLEGMTIDMLCQLQQVRQRSLLEEEIFYKS